PRRPVEVSNSFSAPASSPAPPGFFLALLPEHAMIIEITPKDLSYRVTMDGQELGIFDQPFFQSARVLLSRGVAPDTLLQMRRPGGAIALSGRVGEAAKLSVSETRTCFVRWRPFSSSSVRPKTGLSPSGAARTSPSPQNAS